MVKIYYHIYAVDGIEKIMDEQLNLIQNFFTFPYLLNVGISTPFQNKDISKILENVYKYAKSNYAIRDVRYKSSEFVTLDLIENDCKNGIIKDDDFVLYLHSKGASYIDRDIKRFENTQSWRRIMEYFLIEKHKDVFNIFNKTDFNTYGVFLYKRGRINLHYSGNFWWIRGDYAKTLDTSIIDKNNRYNAESHFIQMGDWKPYCLYNNEPALNNIYGYMFKREVYSKDRKSVV